MLNSRYLQSSTQWLFLIVQYVFNLTVKILPYMQGPFPRLCSFLIFLTSKSMRWYVSLHFWSLNFVSGQMIWYIRHLWPARTRSCISSAIILTCIQALRDILELARRCVDVDQALGMCDLQQAGFSSKNKSKPNIFPWQNIHGEKFICDMLACTEIAFEKVLPSEYTTSTKYSES